MCHDREFDRRRALFAQRLKRQTPSAMLQPYCRHERYVIISRQSCPTSPTHNRPVSRSNEIRHGLRNP